MERIKKLIKNSLKPLFWFLLIFIFAFLINTHIIPDRHIMADELPRITKGNITYIDLNSLNSTEKLQESISSGNIEEIGWRLIYLGSGRDELCFKIIDKASDFEVFVNYTLGKSYPIINKKCLSVPKTENETTFNLVYNRNFTIPNIPSGQIINSSECLPGSKDESINETCIIDGVAHICHPCLSKPIITEAYSFPEIQIYFRADLFHRIIKFIFIFVLTAILIKELLETFYFFIRNRK